MLELSWEGFIQHTIQGWNIGKPPYGYQPEKIPHPVPARRAEGRTKHRLVPDPVRGPVVTRVYHLRAIERLSYDSIADRLNTDSIADRLNTAVSLELVADVVNSPCGAVRPGHPAIIHRSPPNTIAATIARSRCLRSAAVNASTSPGSRTAAASAEPSPAAPPAAAGAAPAGSATPAAPGSPRRPRAPAGTRTVPTRSTTAAAPSAPTSPPRHHLRTAPPATGPNRPDRPTARS